MDVSMALDLMPATYEQGYEVAIIVGQDSDFRPAVRLARVIAQAQSRTLVFESAFPAGPGSVSGRGVPRTAWVRIDQAVYDTCRDLRKYSPSRR